MQENNPNKPKKKKKKIKNSIKGQKPISREKKKKERQR